MSKTQNNIITFIQNAGGSVLATIILHKFSHRVVEGLIKSNTLTRQMDNNSLVLAL